MKQITTSILVIILAISMLLCISVSAVAPPIWSCNDVKPGMWFYSTMRCLYEDRVMVGDGCGNLFPDRPITRGELVALLARIDSDYQSNSDKYMKSCFDDVDAAQYYNQPIIWAKESGIVSGISENLFAPDALTTREQFFKIVANYIQIIEYPTEGRDVIQFKDFDDTSFWAKDAALTCVRSGLISGFPDGTLQPKGNVTRAQTAEVIYRLNEYVWMKIASGQGNGGNGNINSAPPYQIPPYYYTSWEDFYSELKNLSVEDLSEIQYLEKRNMVNTLKTTYVSEDEKKNGIFDSARRILLNKTKVLLPYYQNQPLPLDNRYGYSLELSVSDMAKKPWISCYTTLDVGFRMMLCDPALVDEANEKGASWLFSVLEPDAMNVYNYEEIRDKIISDGILSDYNVVVYEKEYTLKDREVLAMVIDHPSNEAQSNIAVYFVYDELLVCIFGDSAQVDTILPDLYFDRIEMSE